MNIFNEALEVHPPSHLKPMSQTYNHARPTDKAHYKRSFWESARLAPGTQHCRSGATNSRQHRQIKILAK